KIQIRSRTTSKNGTWWVHHSGVFEAIQARRGRARSQRRRRKASGVSSFGGTSAGGGSGEPRNSPKKRRSESSWCFRTSWTELDRGWMRKAISAGAKQAQMVATLFVSPA